MAAPGMVTDVESRVAADSGAMYPEEPTPLGAADLDPAHV